MASLAALQHACSADRAENLARGLALVREAAQAGARLAVLPEIHLSPFFPKARRGDASPWAMRLDDPALAALQAAARDHRIVIVANVYLEDETSGLRHDASPVIDADGAILGVTRMHHIAQFDGFWEQDYYAPGAPEWPVYDTAAGRLGVVICYDRHFPESYRACARAGAEIVATPTCIEAGEPLDLWEAEMRTLAFQNSLYAVLANRCGREEDRAYAGGSLVAGPDGAVLARAGDGDAAAVAPCDLDARARLARARGFVRPEA